MLEDSGRSCFDSGEREERRRRNEIEGGSGRSFGKGFAPRSQPVAACVQGNQEVREQAVGVGIGETKNGRKFYTVSSQDVCASLTGGVYGIP